MSVWAGRRVVAMIPHPDDETFMSGFLAWCAAGGARVEVVCATRGEAGPSFGEEDGPLGEIRSAELAEACRRLGLEAPAFLDLPDGRVGETPDAATRVGAALYSRMPHAVVTLGSDGAYGHRDHVALTSLVMEAVGVMTSARPRLIHAAFPKGALVPLYRAMRASSPAVLDESVSEETLGSDVSRADLHLSLSLRAPDPEATEEDVGASTVTLAALKRYALSAHRSQLPGGDPDRFVAPGVFDALSRDEWYLNRG